MLHTLHELPKAELHLHIEGTLEPEMVFELAYRNDVNLPFSDIEELRSRYAFTDLSDFLSLYYTCMSVLRTSQDFTELATAYLDRAHADGVRHVELFFDPQVHLRNGVHIDEVIDGLLAAFRQAADRYGTTGGLILCFVRDRPVDEAMATVEAVAHRREDLLGVGLDSAEVGYPPALFAPVFDRARALGLRTVAHAGEEGPPAYVWEALDLLGVERIDHGIRAVEDPSLVARLREDQVPLTVCPLSNVRLGCVPSIAQHPLATLIGAGVRVTINSDDPAYFGGYIGDNYTAVHTALGLDANALADLAENSVLASFATPERQSQIMAEIGQWRAANAPRDVADDPMLL